MSQKELVLIMSFEKEIFLSIQNKNAQPYKTDFLLMLLNCMQIALDSYTRNKILSNDISVEPSLLMTL